ncbi:MAG: hypothetical protein AAF575_14530 [Bacteroidota bacterium]
MLQGKALVLLDIKALIFYGSPPAALLADLLYIRGGAIEIGQVYLAFAWLIALKVLALFYKSKEFGYFIGMLLLYD